MKLNTLGVIPARFGAQRFPGKPLALIAGKPLIQRVYEQAAQCSQLDKIIVATEDTRILEAVTHFGGDALLTSPACATGTVAWPRWRVSTHAISCSISRATNR